MDGVEFIDDPTSDEPDARPVEPSTTTRPVLVAAVAWLAAAALAAIAGKTVIYTYAFVGYLKSNGGWRADGTGLNSGLVSDISPQFSVPLWACAVLVAAAGVVSLRVRTARAATIARLVGFGGSSALATTFAIMVLWVRSSITTQQEVAQAVSGGGEVSVHTPLGPSLYLVGVAVVLAAAALAAPVVAAHRDRLGQVRKPITPP